MPEVLSMSHGGIRCAIPPSHVIGAESSGPSDGFVAFWPANAGQDSDRIERALRVATADGPRWIRCADAHLVWVSEVMIWRLPPLLRGLMTASHVVGIAEIDNELAWLVNVKRFFPTSSAG